MGKQIIAQGGGCPRGCLGGKILGCQGACQANQGQQHQNASHFKNISAVPAPYAHVHHTGHHQGHKQLKAGLQHLKQRSQYAF